MIRRVIRQEKPAICSQISRQEDIKWVPFNSFFENGEGEYRTHQRLSVLQGDEPSNI